ncbi:MAG: hypothetical protein ABIO68_04365 [Sphingomicrobium sp.]
MKSVSFDRQDKEWSSGGKNAKEHKLKFDKGSGAHKISFLVGTPQGRYEFNQDDPIWVKEDNGNCPAAPCSHPDIEVEKCNLTQLVIENKNDAKATLRYQLNVFDNVKSEWCPIDPIIDNGGNGRL